MSKISSFSSLREHFRILAPNALRPKKPYNTVEDIKQDLGPQFAKMNHYICSVCGRYHTAKYPLTPKTSKVRK